MDKCEDCKNYGRINKEMGERCFIRSETKYPSWFKTFNGCVRAYPIPKERKCSHFTSSRKVKE